LDQAVVQISVFYGGVIESRCGLCAGAGWRTPGCGRSEPVGAAYRTDDRLRDI